MSDDLTIAYNLGYTCAKDMARDEIERLRAENEKLRELIRNVSRGIQSYRPDINMAGVWLKPLQEIDAYLRELDEAAAIRESGE